MANYLVPPGLARRQGKSDFRGPGFKTDWGPATGFPGGGSGGQKTKPVRSKSVTSSVYGERGKPPSGKSLTGSTLDFAGT